MENPIKHCLTGTEFSRDEIDALISLAKAMKTNPALFHQALAGKSLVMLFEKPSFRTRLSFSMAIQSMGGFAIESISSTRKQEEPADLIRVLNGYADFVMLRTHDDQIFQDMATYAAIPIINGLSALYHPCQILADIMSLEEKWGQLAGLTVAYIGDGNNILHSLMLMAPQLGIHINYCCPVSHQPSPSILQQAQKLAKNQIHSFATPEQAVHGADAVYTDVWVSMGFEEQSQTNAFQGFQVNETLMSQAKSDAVFMHCMPMERGKEVSTTLPDSPQALLFTQSENRMHIQKALLLTLYKKMNCNQA